MKGGDKMDAVISLVLTSVATVISGFVLFYIQRVYNDQKIKDSQVCQEKNTENELILRSLNALGKLTVANTIALRDGKTTEEMTEALYEYSEVEKEMYRYMVSHCSK